MGIGTVGVKIQVDDPRRIRLGSQDEVTGSVTLTFHPKASQQITPELFAPLTITVFLQGRAKTKIWKSNGRHRTIYRGRVPLLHISGVIHNGKCKLAAEEAQSFRFVMQFPESVATYSPGWEDDAVFRSDGRLPPTMGMSYHGFAHRYDCFTEYNVSCAVSIPGIEVDIQHYVQMAPILYGMSAIPSEAANRNKKRTCNWVGVQNENLMLEEHRPHGFRQKAKAVFKSDFYPSWAAEIWCETQQNLYLNEGLTFTLSLKPSPKNNAEIEPTVTLWLCQVELTAHTLVRAEGLFYYPSSEGNDLAANFAVQASQPFSKANDWSITITTAPIQGLVESFVTHNISRGYTMQIVVYLKLAGKEEKVRYSMPVLIHPPVRGSPGVADVVEGSSSAASAAVAAGTSSAGVLRAEQEQLPAYAPPPTYEDAMHSDEEDGQSEDEGGRAEGSSAVENLAQGVEDMDLAKGKGKEVVA